MTSDYVYQEQCDIKTKIIFNDTATVAYQIKLTLTASSGLN